MAVAITSINSSLTLPIASKPLSKNNITPRNMNTVPNPVSPTPISAEIQQ